MPCESTDVGATKILAMLSDLSRGKRSESFPQLPFSLKNSALFDHAARELFARG
jgi:hypothetical protein